LRDRRARRERRAGEKQREARERSDVRPAREAVGRERDRLDLHRHGPHADQGLEDGTIEFKTRSNDGETFTAAHIHQGAVGIEAPPPVELLFGGPDTSASKIKQSRA